MASDILYNRIMEKLKFEPYLDETHITLSIKEDGIVILGGKVKSYTEKHLAEEAVEKVEEVKGIANEIRVELDLAYKRDDADIARAALNSLRWTLFIPHETLKVAVEDGHITLSGEVNTHYQKMRAENAVRDLYGVTHVSNNILLKPTATPNDVKNKIINEFERNARIEAERIKISVEGSTVTLEGEVKDMDARNEAKYAAWCVPGIDKIIDKLSIRDKH